jgi:hypothetical protein
LLNRFDFTLAYVKSAFFGSLTSVLSLSTSMSSYPA